MPSIEEAWNLPISAEMSSRQQQQQQPPGGPGYKYGAAPSGPPPPYPQTQGQGLNTKRFKVTHSFNNNSNNKNKKSKVLSSGSWSWHCCCERLISIKILIDQKQPGDDSISPPSPQRPPPFYLSPQQLQMLQFLQQNQSSLTPQQQGLLAQLQHQYRAMQQHQQQIRLQQQQAAQRGLRPGQPGYPTAYSHGQPSGQPGVIKNYGIPQQPVYIIFFLSY